jgi:hypothetical protein
MEIGWKGMDWIHLAQDRDRWWALVNTVMNLQVPLKAGNRFVGISISVYTQHIFRILQ